MKAAILVKPGDLRFDDIAQPLPLAGEVRIKLKATGICGSDVHFFKGDRPLAKPTIIGHEGLGIIDMLGEGARNLQLGQRVVIEPNIPCFACSQCLQGRGNICSNKRVIGLTENGCFAEYICVPAAFCHPVPDTVSDADAVTVEPLAVAYHALFKTHAKPGDTIAVVGLGAIGLLLTQLAIALGYRVIVTELMENKRQMAIDMGAMATDANSKADGIASYWLRMGVMAVFECSGVAEVASLVTDCAPRCSQIVLLGLSEKLASFQPLKLAREGIDLIGSIIYQHPFDFKRVLYLVEKGVIHPGKIISQNMAFENIRQAFELALQGSHSKIVIQIS